MLTILTSSLIIFYIQLKREGNSISSQKLQMIFSKSALRGDFLKPHVMLIHYFQPPMSDHRKYMIKKAFQTMDKTGDGKITYEDLSQDYDVTNHPKYKNGEWTKKECLEHFLKTFDDPNDTGESREVGNIYHDI